MVQAGDEAAHDGADDQEGHRRLDRAPPADGDAGEHQGEAGGGHREDGEVEGVELRHAEVELALVGRGGGEHGAAGDDDPEAAERLGLREGKCLSQQEDDGEGAHRAAGDELQVGGAPERDVEAVGIVPQVVEREGGNGCQAHHAEEEASVGHPEVAEAELGRRLLGGGERDGDGGGEDQAAEPEQDGDVGRGEEGADVTAEVDVP